MLLLTLEQEEICLTFPVGIGIYIAYMIKKSQSPQRADSEKA